MHRKSLLTLLRAYTPSDAHERAMWQDTILFVEAHPNCFERSLMKGHITGSAWIVSPDREQVVLIHHRKLDRWLQPGGHADGDPDVAAVALREAQEETGLQSLKLLSPTIFDVDVHQIPAKGEAPAHYHYDIRFLFEADTSEAFQQTLETKDIKWVEIEKVPVFTTDLSVLRMIYKKK